MIEFLKTYILSILSGLISLVSLIAMISIIHEGEFGYAMAFGFLSTGLAVVTVLDLYVTVRNNTSL